MPKRSKSLKSSRRTRSKSPKKLRGCYRQLEQSTCVSPCIWADKKCYSKTEYERRKRLSPRFNKLQSFGLGAAATTSLGYGLTSNNPLVSFLSGIPLVALQGVGYENPGATIAGMSVGAIPAMKWARDYEREHPRYTLVERPYPPPPQ